jgi:serine/threonine protein phosphatase PrpC
MAPSRNTVPSSGERDADPWVDAGWATDPGPRPDNQDRAAASPRWAVVSDGVGGQPGGAVAATLAVEAAVARLSAAPRPATGEEAVAEVVAAANTAVRTRQAADAHLATMAATLTLAVAEVVEATGSWWHVANVGDSPGWLVTGRDLTLLTVEHNMAAELARAGAITPEEARHHPGRNLVTRVIGGEDAVAASSVSVSLRPGDRLVLASDGVEVVGEAALVEAIDTARDAGDAARRLVDAALAAGATDNVTVAVVQHRDGAG